jgi:hypothetical protein
MRFRLFFVLAASLLAVAGCVIEPYGGDGHGYHEHGEHEYGRGVWRG